MNKAVQAARKAIENTYQGVFSITERKKVKDEKSKQTSYTDVLILENQPCRLSFENIANAEPSETAVKVTQVIKLFISPDIIIKPNSKITVTQDNITTDYKSSGIAAVYLTHQEIILELFERWA